ATGMLSGTVALAVSYAKASGRPLHPGETIALVKSAATDVNLGKAVEGDFRYSSFPGWDTLSGYGRTNAFTMLDTIRKNQIPPEARIVSPDWFAVINRAAKSNLSVAIEVRKPRSGMCKIRLEIARGVETSSA